MLVVKQELERDRDASELRREYELMKLVWWKVILSILELHHLESLREVERNPRMDLRVVELVVEEHLFFAYLIQRMLAEVQVLENLAC